MELVWWVLAAFVAFVIFKIISIVSSLSPLKTNKNQQPSTRRGITDRHHSSFIIHHSSSIIHHPSFIIHHSSSRSKAMIPYAKNELNSLPGPKPTSWLQGNTKELIAEPALRPHERWFKELGHPKLFRYYWALNEERLAICDADLVKEALKSEGTNFSKRLFSYNFLRRLIGDGLVTQLSAKHKIHSRLINPSFNVPVCLDFRSIPFTYSLDLRPKRNHT